MKYKIDKSCYFIITLLLLLLSGVTVNVAFAQSRYTHRVYIQKKPIYIKGGYYFDVHSMKMVKNKGILIRGGRFFKVGGKPAPDEPQDYKIIKLSENEYILPGLIDVHAHYRMDAFGNKKLHHAIDEFKYNVRIYLANGVTSTWSAGVYYPKLEWAASYLIKSGQWLGPRLFQSGPYFGQARPDWNKYNHTKQEIYNEVDYWVNHGVDAFKLKEPSPKVAKWVIQRAHMHGLLVTGHLNSGFRNTTNSITAINDGIDRVEHILGGFVLDNTKPAYPVWNRADTSSKTFKKTEQYFINHHVYFDPTVNAAAYYAPKIKKILDTWVNEPALFTSYVQKLVEERTPRKGGSKLMYNLFYAMHRGLKAFYDNGGASLITHGSDAPSHGKFLAGFSSQREVEGMVKAGLPPAIVLKAATLTSAESIGKGSILGSIDTGKLADLFIVKGNPLKDITNTHNIQLVIKGGVTYDPKKLLNSTKGRIGPKGSWDVNDWWKYPMLERVIGNWKIPAGYK